MYEELIEKILIVTRRAGASDQKHYELEVERVLLGALGPAETAQPAEPAQEDEVEGSAV